MSGKRVWWGEAPETTVDFREACDVVGPIACKAEALPSRWSIAGSCCKTLAHQGNGSDFASTMLSKLGGAWSYVGQVGASVGLASLVASKHVKP
jgi:hypothetical protein